MPTEGRDHPAASATVCEDQKAFGAELFKDFSGQGNCSTSASEGKPPVPDGEEPRFRSKAELESLRNNLQFMLTESWDEQQACVRFLGRAALLTVGFAAGAISFTLPFEITATFVGGGIGGFSIAWALGAFKPGGTQ